MDNIEKIFAGLMVFVLFITFFVYGGEFLYVFPATDGTATGELKLNAGGFDGCYSQVYAESLGKQYEKDNPEGLCMLLILSGNDPAPCLDPNSRQYEPTNFYNVMCGKRWLSRGNIAVSKNGVEIWDGITTECLRDSDCSKFEGVSAQFYYSGHKGIFGNDLACVEGSCKQYYRGEPVKSTGGQVIELDDQPVQQDSESDDQPVQQPPEQAPVEPNKSVLVLPALILAGLIIILIILKGVKNA